VGEAVVKNELSGKLVPATRLRELPGKVIERAQYTGRVIQGQKARPAQWSHLKIDPRRRVDVRINPRHMKCVVNDCGLGAQQQADGVDVDYGAAVIGTL
jgi:hypothetical protein